MSKKLIAGICVAVIALSACKKTLPDMPLPVSNQTAYYPAGYNPNLKSKKKSLGNFNGAINDIVIDSTDKRNAFIIGSFNYIGSQSATGICKYLGLTQSLSSYLLDIKLNYPYNIKSFAQYNGKHYLGGYWYDNNFSYRYFGEKMPGSSSVFYNLSPTADVNAMKVRDGSLYLSGNFNSLSGVGGQVSPLVYINTNTQYFGNATFSTYNVKKIAYINSTWILATNYANGYLLFSSGGNWYTAFGGGFDNQVNDLDVFENTLYAAGNMQSAYATGVPLNYVNYFDYNSNSWKPLGSNNLPGPCLDLEYYNNTLYASGYGGSTYIYYLDKSTNTWKSFLSSSVKADYAPTKIAFVNGKLLVVEYGTLYLYE